MHSTCTGTGTWSLGTGTCTGTWRLRTGTGTGTWRLSTGTCTGTWTTGTGTGTGTCLLSTWYKTGDQCLVRAFVQYAEGVDDIFQRHGVHIICSLTTCRVTSADDLTTFPKFSRLESCIIDIYAWCGAKRLQLNVDKTELLWFCPASQLHRLPSHNNSINVNQCVVKPLTVVRDLCVWFDAELSMRSHVSRVAQTCFTICAEYVPFDDSSAATLQRD